MAEWLRDDPEFIAELNRANSFRRERLRADVRSLASDAMAAFRELISDYDVPPAFRLRVCLAVLHAADALNAEQIGPMSTEGVPGRAGSQAVGRISWRMIGRTESVPGMI
jgi:hypothetical protein